MNQFTGKFPLDNRNCLIFKSCFCKKKKNTVRVTLGKCDENYYNLGGYSHVFPSKILFKAVMGMGKQGGDMIYSTISNKKLFF